MEKFVQGCKLRSISKLHRPTESFCLKEVRKKKTNCVTVNQYCTRSSVMFRKFILTTWLPPQYIFQLIPCFKPSCCHAVCKRAVGASASDICWFTGGPPITFLPLPVLRPWGNPNCLKLVASGHYFKPSMSALVGIQLEPPSAYTRHSSQGLLLIHQR